ncbi:MAG: hypothetical protein JNM35_00530 [Nitrospira sp.]|nr:hypothetical protein [Nitrospira sp.]
MKRKRMWGTVRAAGLCLLSVVVLLSGCALTFGYRHADWLISWQLDHYLDLTAGQRRDVTARLKPLLTRHRAEAIPRYEQFLKELQQRVSGGLTGDDLEWVYASYDRFRADLLERAIPDGSALLVTVNERQIRNLEDVFRKEEQKAIRALQGSSANRLDERTRKLLAIAEDWLGPLSPEQVARISPFTRALPDTQPVLWHYRRQRQQELLTVLRRPASIDDMSLELRMMFVQSDQTAPVVFREMVKELRASLTRLLLETDRLLTVQQRRKAVTSIQRLIDDLHSLSQGS